MIHFTPSDGMKIHLLPEQEDFLSSKAYIRSVIGRADLVALDIFYGEQLIGFAMLRRYRGRERSLAIILSVGLCD